MPSLPSMRKLEQDVRRLIEVRDALLAREPSVQRNADLLETRKRLNALVIGIARAGGGKATFAGLPGWLRGPELRARAMLVEDAAERARERQAENLSLFGKKGSGDPAIDDDEPDEGPSKDAIPGWV